MALLGALLCVPSLVAAAEPTAADKATARAFVLEGRAKLQAKDYKAALKLFRAAHEIMGVPTTGLDLARAQAALGMLIEAQETALHVTRIPVAPKEPAVFSEARAQAQELADALAPRVPSLVVGVVGVPEGTEVRVDIDGATMPSATLQLPRKVNPGPHDVVVTAPGYAPAQRRVSVREGATERVEIALASTVDAPPVAPPALADQVSSDGDDGDPPVSAERRVPDRQHAPVRVPRAALEISAGPAYLGWVGGEIRHAPIGERLGSGPGVETSAGVRVARAFTLFGSFSYYALGIGSSQPLESNGWMLGGGVRWVSSQGLFGFAVETGAAWCPIHLQRIGRRYFDADSFVGRLGAGFHLRLNRYFGVQPMVGGSLAVMPQDSDWSPVLFGVSGGLAVIAALPLTAD